MRKISARVLSSKPVSLSRAAKLMIRFAAVENGASPAVYLQRTADAFNHLVQFYNKRPKIGDGENSPERKGVQKPQTDSVEGKEEKQSKIKLESDGETGKEVDEANPYRHEVKVLDSVEKEEMKKNKKKKEKSDGDDSKEMRNSKKRRAHDLES